LHPRLERIESAYFTALRRSLSARAHDHTEKAQSSSAMIVAPHPDDETLACGATILRKRALGRRVWIVIVTDGGRSHSSAIVSPAELVRIRRAEAIEACRRMDVPDDDLIFLDAPDSGLATHRAEVHSRLAELLSRHRPDEIYSPSVLDRHPDHREVASLTRLAAASVGYEALLEYVVWPGRARAWAGAALAARSRLWRALSRPANEAVLARPVTVAATPHLDAKRHALTAYASQLENLTGEPHWATMDSRFLSRFFEAKELFFRHALVPAIRAGSASASLLYT
jgi:LmbE family N-acetylglucosaminyl deacetylase